jgi:two-component sensor histidine kinase
MPEFPFLPSKGVMARRLRAFDWASTPLGDARAWPRELKAAAGFLIESRFPGAIIWGPSLTTIYNDAFLPILGNKEDALGRPFSAVWSEVWSEIKPLMEQAFSGESVFIENFPLVIERSDKPEQAYFTFCYSPLRMADGTIGGVMDTVVETTDTVNAYAQRKLLNEELSHRLKNTIQIVQAISTQTFKGTQERDAVDAFNKRLIALGRSHDILMQQSWTRASMKQVMEATLASISDRKRIDIEGSDIDIGSKAVLALALVLHELATNAAKYGAHATETGRVRIRSQVESGMLFLTWEETGGPAVTPPSAQGFGSRIIAMGLGGTVESDFKPNGLSVRISANISDLQRL